MPDIIIYRVEESVVDILRKVLTHVNCDTNGDNRSRRKSCHKLNVTCDRTGKSMKLFNFLRHTTNLISSHQV
jgi:hypothetical protein